MASDGRHRRAARDAVVARFSEGVAEAQRGGGDVVVVDHGMALTLWVASVARIELAAWWRALTVPEAWRVDPPTGESELLFRGTPA